MKFTSLSFPTCVIGSSLAEIVKIESIRISNLNDLDKGRDCEVTRAGKIRHRNKIRLAVNLCHICNEIT